MLDICEKAVKLAPDNGLVRDAGAARALTGNTTGAADDFESAVKWAQETGETGGFHRVAHGWARRYGKARIRQMILTRRRWSG